MAFPRVRRPGCFSHSPAAFSLVPPIGRPLGFGQARSLSSVVSRLPRRRCAWLRSRLSTLPPPGRPSAKCSAACWALPLAFSLLSLPARLRASAGHTLTTAQLLTRSSAWLSCLFYELVSACNQALGLLVSSSCAHCCASTDDLSPGSLPGALLSFRNGNLILEGGFTLRCLQRLSLPHFASLRCPWQDNSFTSGASTPVLSY